MSEPVAITEEFRQNACAASATAAVFQALASGAGVVTLDTMAMIYVRAVLQVHGGNKARTARALGISRRSLYRMLDREAA